MKILLNPILLSLLLALVMIICSIFIYAIGRRRIESNLLNLEQSFTFVFLTLLLVGDDRSYVGNLSVQYLGTHAENRNASLYIILQLVTYLLVIFLLRSRSHYLVKAIVFLCRDPFLLGLLILGVLSSFWSETPLDTFKSSLVLVGLAIYASIIAVRCNLQELTKYLREFGLWVTVSSALVQIFLPSVSGNTKDSWQGITGHPNVLGAVMALSTVLWWLNAIDRPKQRWGSMMLATGSLIVMMLTNSSGSKVIFFALISLSTLFRVLKHLQFRQAATALLFFLVFGIPLSLAILNNTDAIFGILGKDKNLTGRGEFWPDIIAAIDRRLFLGYGYQGFWQSWRGAENPAAHIRTPYFIPTHSHNGFFELALALGLVGIFLFSLSFLKNTIHVFLMMYFDRLPEAEISLLLLTYIISSNLSESGLWATGYHPFIYILLSVRHGMEFKKEHVLNKSVPP